ncbi:MAG: immune inhibitor A [Saprospiraceae bacterium]|nr:immune inhibitor A [Saprospiraceae bacterium]
MRQVHLLLFFLLTFSLQAQQQELQSRVFIHLDQTHTIEDLAALGVEADHGNYAPQKHLINDFSESEIQLIANAGFTYDIQIADVTNWYQEQLASGQLETRNLNCGGTEDLYHYDIPENWAPGSFAGFFTYQEMLDELDSMAVAYPDLISPRAQIGDIFTHDNNPIYWLRISDNAQVDESEPEVLYTALHHAREPGSMSQMIFYMWYILERYGTDPEVTYLIDNTEMYFVPCVNPDGYLYNEATNPDGGGFWRKNRRDNLDGSFGVDLNRNYGFGWGYDDIGSSPNTNSSTYRGPEPFSEPETTALQFLCNQHEFQIALNYHTFGNLLIYPWGYLDSPSADSITFNGFADALTVENNFFAGIGSETVGYTVNGNSDDWMYGENTTKPAIYSMTPEVGPDSYGFWPTPDYIETLIQSTLLQNLTTAHLVLNFGLARDDSPLFFTDWSSSIDYTLRRYGLMDGDLTVSLTALSNNILSVLDGPQSYTLDMNESVSNSFGFDVAGTTTFGEELVFLLSVDNGSVIRSDTLRKTFYGGELETVFMSDGEDIGTWTANDSWGLTGATYYSAPNSITDSPDAPYQNNSINSLVSPAIDLTGVENADLNFWAIWNTESNYDYVLVEAVDVITGTSTPLCGLYTNPGVEPFQPLDVPIYDGTQADWVQESICLDDFIGSTIYIEFSLYADGGVTADGFYFDDLEISTIIPDTFVNVSTLELQHQNELRLFPNPTSGYVWVDLPLGDLDQEKDIQVYDALGRMVLHQSYTGKRARVDISGLADGFYLVEVLQKDKQIGASPLLINGD